MRPRLRLVATGLLALAIRVVVGMLWPAGAPVDDSDLRPVRRTVARQDNGFYYLQQALKKCQENVSVAATQILLALRGYKIDHGTLPDSLADLVPPYLARVPLDDFDGNPMRYSKAKKLVWSVGKNLRDDHGVTTPREGGPDDIAFEMAF